MLAPEGVEALHGMCMRGIIKMMHLTDHSLALTTYHGPVKIESIKALTDDT